MRTSAPFVGRTEDLRALKSWLTEAAGGRPRVALLDGEPGVGKSTLVDRFVADALRRKQPPTVLQAVCYQDVHVPYLPLATALQPVGDLTRLLRPLDDTPERGDDRRLHLYLGVVDLIARAARDAPVLLVLDDLQWADQGTLDLLAHVLQVSAQTSGGRRIMTVLAHRPVSEGAVAEFVERLRRIDATRARSLAGLDTFALHELVEAVTGERPSRKLLDGLDEASAGNPLLARSLLERLEAFGVLTVRSGHLTHRGGEELLAGPAELDELLRHRLRDLPRACLDLLVVAAFLGEDQPLESVRAVMGAPTERFQALVEQAVTARVLLDHEVVRFHHPQVRQVVFQRPRGVRRQQLHLRVADHLESLPDDPARAVAIAHHLRRAGELASPDRVLQASLRSAAHAASVVAWGEAARAYEAAIEAAEAGAQQASALVALLHARAAYAHWYNHDNGSALRNADRAIELAMDLGDLALWTTALVTRARATWSGEGAAYGSRFDLGPYDEFLAFVGDREPALRARVHFVRAALHVQATDVDAAQADIQLARENVDRDDGALQAEMEFAAGGIHLADLELEDAARCMAQAGSFGNDASTLVQVATLRGRAMVHWARGELDEAARAIDEGVALGSSAMVWAECSLQTAMAAGIAVARGDGGSAERFADSAVQLMRWAGYPPTAQTVYPALACARAQADDLDGARRALDDWAAVDGRGVDRYRDVLNALAGDIDAVRPFRTRRPILAPKLFQIPAIAVAVELGDLLDDEERISWALPGITAAVTRGVRFELGWCFFLPRLAAVAHARLGHHDEAATWFAVGERDAVRAGAPLEHDRVVRDRARLLGR